MHFISKLTILIIIYFFSFQNSHAITASVQNGNWTNSNTWNNSGPGCGDTIYISSGTTVIVNAQIDFFSSCGAPMFLVVEGTLQFNNGPKIQLPCGSGVLVKQGGMIIGGGGKGSQNAIDICGVTEWIRIDGDILNPISFGAAYSEKIISITSGSWNLSSTWDCSCDPQFYHSPIIDTMHVVSISSTTEIHDLYIYGTLDAASLLGNFNLNGNWLNSGTFLEGNSLINFKGNIAQQISGSTNFYNLSINNSAGVSISSGNMNLINTLLINNGNFTTNNALTLISNASGTARIAAIPTGADIIGNINMQRYIDAGATDWRFLTSAVSGTTLADFNDDFITSGFTGSDFPLWPTAANPWASIYFYDETQAGIQDSGFVAATNVTNPVAPGEGIWVWSGDTITGTQPFTIDMLGPPNKGTINLPITYTNSGLPAGDGWNMVGNPYPSTIDWYSPNITKTGINAAIYIWNTDLQQFASYVFPFGTNGGSRYIASSQAFWVQAATAGASVQVTEQCKSATDAAFLKPSNPAYLSIEVVNSFGTDETVINFEENATNGFDALYDALKMASVNTSLPYVSTVLGSNEYSINQLPRQEINIPLKITCGTSGIHQINFDGIANFSNSACLLLEDLFTGAVYDLNTTSSITAYIFDSTQTARFLIKFGAEYNISSDDVSCFGYNDGQIQLEKNSPTIFDITLKDTLGNMIANHTNVTVFDSIQNLQSGTYLLESTDNSCGNKIDTIIIVEPSQIVAQFTSNTDTVYLSNGGNIDFINQSANANYYSWDFGDFNTSSLTSPSYIYTQDGNYNVTLNAYQTANCHESFVKNITVLGIITSIDNSSQNITKIWVNDNKLIINGNDMDVVDVRNILGQQLFLSNQVAGEQVFNLESLSSQTLIVTIYKANQISSTKVQFIKQ